ncbi:MAG: hypothetical protein Ct9H90mP16_04300 [Candidatus Poseidoniales archaeon]|nr:MAG: hypothetical protein Ct9H90mP16_04300 [Candidatus Poseidoniales archaeon]
MAIFTTMAVLGGGEQDPPKWFIGNEKDWVKMDDDEDEDDFEALPAPGETSQGTGTDVHEIDEEEITRGTRKMTNHSSSATWLSNSALSERTGVPPVGKTERPSVNRTRRDPFNRPQNASFPNRDGANPWRHGGIVCIERRDLPVQLRFPTTIRFGFRKLFTDLIMERGRIPRPCSMSSGTTRVMANQETPAPSQARMVRVSFARSTAPTREEGGR